MERNLSAPTFLKVLRLLDPSQRQLFWERLEIREKRFRYITDLLNDRDDYELLVTENKKKTEPRNPYLKKETSQFERLHVKPRELVKLPFGVFLGGSNYDVRLLYNRKLKADEVEIIRKDDNGDYTREYIRLPIEDLGKLYKALDQIRKESITWSKKETKS